MKVIAFNGSPNEEGNTAYAIQTVAKQLLKQNIEVEVIQVGNQQIRGCMSCRSCKENIGSGCVIADERFTDWMKKMWEADGIILGSPVYFSGITGTMKSFLDRAFFAYGSYMEGKVGTAIVTERRAGGVAALDQMHHYLTYGGMITVSSCYWNLVFGRLKGEADQDEEGMMVMRTLGNQMAWLLKVVDAGKKQITLPEKESRVYTNFIR